MNHALSRFSLLIVGILWVPLLQAQGLDGGVASPLYIGSQRAPVRVSSLVLYQHIEDDAQSFTQLSTPLSITAPLARGVGLSIRTAYATIEGEGIASLDGLGDTQIGLSVHRDLGAASVVAHVGANMPSGTGTLTRAQAETAFLIGQGFYNTRLPNLGQGFNVAPGLTVAVPLSEQLAFGVGAAYQYRGAFQPLTEREDEYDPGDELLLIGGIDYRASETLALALDLTYIRYGTDTWGAVMYETGDVVAVTLQGVQALGPHQVRVRGRLQQKQESDVPAEALPFLGQDAAVPTRILALVHGRFQVNPRVRIGAFARGRYYAESDAFSDKGLADIGLVPEIRLLPELSLVGRLAATFGDVTALEGGLGFSWSM